MSLFRSPLVASAGSLLLFAAACAQSGTIGDDAGETTDAGVTDAGATDGTAKDGGGDSASSLFAIRVHVTGLASSTTDGGLGDAGTDSLVLANGSDTLTVTQDGTFAFPNKVPTSTPYAVTIAAQPTSPAQTCTVSGGSGTVAQSDVTIDVTCATSTFTVSGTITGLTAAGLSLTDTYTGGGGPETLSPAANDTSFAFVQPIKSGETYAVTVTASPTGLLCTVGNGSGAIANANVTNVAVACQPSATDLVYTGAQQTYVVPSLATSLDVTLEGAQGGTDQNTSTNYGGKLTATLAVTGGDTLYVYVGGQPADTSGGFNGGGAGDSGGFGGGGATDIRRGGSALSDRILVAGGGGGAGYWTAYSMEIVGGAGGDLTGGNGYRVPDYATNPGGQGGTQSASGTGTCVSLGNTTVSGALGVGGTTVGMNCGCQGYGGGGGYYGGAASGNCRGGGGGSGYAAAITDITNVVFTTGGAAPGNGHVHIVAH